MEDRGRILAKAAGTRLRRAGALLLVLALVLSGALGVPRTALAAKETVSDDAATIRLMKTEGTTTVSDSAGKTLATTERMRLYSGNHVETAAKSYAWLSLDDAKAVKLDAVSEAEIRKKGKKLEVLLDAGNLLFDVKEKLQDDETLNIRTSTMAMGIRGTAGIVRVLDANTTRVTILDGSVACMVINPVTGDSESIVLNAGETADFVVYDQSAASSSAACEILTGRATQEALSGFVLVEAAGEEALKRRIEAGTGVDLSGLDEREAAELLRADEAETDAWIVRVEEAVAEQERHIAKDPVWGGVPGRMTTATTAPTRTPARPGNDAGTGATQGATGAAGATTNTPGGSGATASSGTVSSSSDSSSGAGSSSGGSSSGTDTPSSGSSSGAGAGTAATYTITWKNDDGTTIDTTTVRAGETPTHSEPTKAGGNGVVYTFDGWTPAVAAASADATYTATWTQKYAITWLDEDGTTILATDYFVAGAMPEYSGTTTKEVDGVTYEISGWRPEIATVTRPATYTAVYKQAVAKYKITTNVVSEDGIEGVVSVSVYNAETQKFEEVTEAERGAWVIINATAVDGYTIACSSEDVSVSSDPKDGNGFYMPAKDVTITINVVQRTYNIELGNYTPKYVKRIDVNGTTQYSAESSSGTISGVHVGDIITVYISPAQSAYKNYVHHNTDNVYVYPQGDNKNTLPYDGDSQCYIWTFSMPALSAERLVINAMEKKDG